MSLGGLFFYKRHIVGTAANSQRRTGRERSQRRVASREWKDCPALKLWAEEFRESWRVEWRKRSGSPPCEETVRWDPKSRWGYVVFQLFAFGASPNPSSFRLLLHTISTCSGIRSSWELYLTFHHTFWETPWEAGIVFVVPIAYAATSLPRITCAGDSFTNLLNFSAKCTVSWTLSASLYLSQVCRNDTLFCSNLLPTKSKDMQVG